MADESDAPGGGEPTTPAGAGGGEPTTPAGAGGGEPTTPGTADASGAEPTSPEELLAQARTVRKQARRARHAYWFPLVFFGLLTIASVPFYIQRLPTEPGVVAGYVATPWYLRNAFLGGLRGPLVTGHVAYYWLAAMLVGLAATAVWYRLRGDRIGLRTPSRLFVIAGLVLLFLVLLIPALPRAGLGPLRVLMPGDLVSRGTFPLVLIGTGICVLAWAERSVALAVIAAGYLALSLVASLYNISNAVAGLGWNVSPQTQLLPNVVLPALVLLLTGAGAWLVQRRQRPPGGSDAELVAPPAPPGGSTAERVAPSAPAGGGHVAPAGQVT